MKRLLLLLVALVIIVSPVCAVTSPIKTDFQDTPYYVSTPPGYATIFQGEWTLKSTLNQNVETGIIDTVGHNRVKIYHPTVGSTSYIINTYPVSSQFTYAAFSEYADLPANSFATISLLDSSGSTIYTFSAISMSPGWNRIEVKMIGGQAKLYRNGDLLLTSAVLAINPSYLYVSDSGNSGPSYSYLDDFVVGYSDDSTIIGSLPSDWFIKFEASAPASTGLYKVNVSNPSMPILKNSNYYGVSYGRSTNASTTLQIIDPIGIVVGSYPVANMSGQATLPIATLYSDGAIRNGLWRVSLADDAETSYFWVMGGGAEGAWSQESYTQGDTATFSYTILDSSWNAGTSTYRFDVLDVYGNVVDTQTISTQTGSKSVTTDSTKYPSGVYYGAVIQTTGGEDTWLAADDMEVSAYIKYVGGIYDAENETQITSNVTVTINQGSITDTKYTTTGVYNSTDGLAFGTGSLTTFTASAAGYQTSVTSFTPMIAKTITKNITLVRSSPTCPVGICLGGLANETIYSRPVANVTIAVTNATYGESYTTSTNSVGWYNLGESDGVFLTNGRCYSVTASKTGYTGNTYLKCVVGT